MAVAVLGGNEFIVGFQLAGIRRVIEVKENISDIMEKIGELKGNKEISIAIVDEKLLNKLDKHDRFDIEASVSPVFVPLSTSSSQENLRYLIKKSIGVDLMS